MVLWFVIVAPVLVAEVFRSPMVDYRLVALGAILPLAEAVFGGPFLLHTLVGAVGSLAVVMVSTRGRRMVRRRLLGIPIGLLLYLVLGAVWTNDQLFLWPAFGRSFDGLSAPIFGLPVVAKLGLEAVAVALGVWAWKRYELSDPQHRDQLRRTGQLARTVMR